MKPPHEMASWERREFFELKLDNAIYMAKLSSDMAQHHKSNPEKCAEWLVCATRCDEEVVRLRNVLSR